MNIKISKKERIKLDEPEKLARIMQRILRRENKIDREKEHFWIAGLNNASTLLHIELVSMGSVHEAPAEPMNVYRVAILKGATQVIAIHNHPSNTMRPSAEDLDLTDRLIQVGHIIQIPMIDHFIISTTDWFSFEEEGLMMQLEQSEKYVPTYELINRIKQKETAIREEALAEERLARRKIEQQKEKAEKEKEKALLKMEEARLKMEKERRLREQEQREKEEERKKKEEAQQKLHTAVRNLHDNQMPLNQIASVLGITVEEAEAALKGRER